MEVLQKISETPVDDEGRRDRARRDQARDDSRHAGRSRSSPRRRRSSAAYRAVLDTSAGPITIEFFPDKAPEHRPSVPAAGRGRRLQRHGVSSRRAGLRHSDRRARRAAPAPLTEKQQKLVHNLAPEFNDTKHVKGIVSMARGDEPDSATTSFFICTGAVDGARRRLHGVRPRRRRDGGGRGDRGGAAERRDADHADRAEDGAGSRSDRAARASASAADGSSGCRHRRASRGRRRRPDTRPECDRPARGCGR